MGRLVNLSVDLNPCFLWVEEIRCMLDLNGSLPLLLRGLCLEKGMLEDMEKVVKHITKEEKEDLMHKLDHCLLMANKFNATNSPQYFVRMEETCESFLETLTSLKKKASK